MSEIIDIKKLVDKNDTYLEFINEIDKLLIGKTVEIYEHAKRIDETTKYTLYGKYFVKKIIKKEKCLNSDYYEKYLKNVKSQEFSNLNAREIFTIFTEVEGRKDYVPVFSTDKIVIGNEMGKRRFTEEDPYGEEEWENDDLMNRLNENVKKEFEEEKLVLKFEDFMNL